MRSLPSDSENGLEFSDKLRRIPPIVFTRLEELRRDKEAQGEEIISFGVGDPDLAPPDKVLKRLHEASLRPYSNRYPIHLGIPELKKAIANWYEARFNVMLDPKTEVMVLCGSKEGIAHVPQAFINPNEGVLIPTPAYPVYQAGTIMAGGVPLSLPLREEGHFFPDLDAIDRKSLDRARMMFLNYPSNPTTVMADESFFERVYHFAENRELIVCHDNAYSELYFDQKRPPSYLQIKGAKEAYGVEFHSFSKSFCMAGFRIGFVVGNKRVIEGLSKIKANTDMGVYTPIQEAAIVALEQGWREGDQYRQVFQSRRDFFCSELKRLKFEFSVPEATFYVWSKVPRGFSSETFTEFLIREAGIILTPGTGFGPAGQGYVRFALTIPEEKIKTAIQRMERALSKR